MTSLLCSDMRCLLYRSAARRSLMQRRVGKLHSDDDRPWPALPNDATCKGTSAITYGHVGSYEAREALA